MLTAAWNLLIDEARRLEPRGRLLVLVADPPRRLCTFCGHRPDCSRTTTCAKPSFNAFQQITGPATLSSPRPAGLIPAATAWFPYTAAPRSRRPPAER